MVNIHPTALVDPKAQLGENVNIDAYAFVGPNVIIGDGSQIKPHAVILPGTRLGRECKVYSHAVIGEIPQDLKFGGEETTAEIGDRTVIREFVTINRGTYQHWRTVVGSDCLLMAYVHVAHDCVVGDHVIFANAVNLAGHVQVEDWAIIGGMTGVHQFVNIGCHVMVGAHYRVSKDVPPYIIAGRDPLVYEGLNLIGLKRRGFKSETIQAIHQAYDIIYRSGLNVSDAVRKLEELNDPLPEVQHIIEFIRKSERGIIR
jgi:UDP-N-acetylglucosamine acyltransferase